MTTVDLTKGKRSLARVLNLARTGPVLIHTASGRDFVLEPADEFEREAALLGGSRKFMSFLKARSKRKSDLSLGDVRRKRGV